MDALIERAAGLDVHQGSVVACIILGAAGRRPTKEVRRFGTMRQDLAALRAWLLEKGVTHVGMEGTGVYWQPVYAALEDAFTLIVGNASHMRNVPGRKTDVKDAEWIADLVRHGLVRASFVPPPEVRVLRELIRHRKALVGTLAAERPVQQSAGALVELLAARAAAEPAIALGGALGSLRHGFRSAFQAPHPRPPLCERRPYTQPSPRRPGAVARALTEPHRTEARPPSVISSPAGNTIRGRVG
jgi:transposase